MAKPKSDKRQQTEPFQVRTTPAVKRYLQTGTEAMEDRLTKASVKAGGDPVILGLGPFMVIAAKEKTRELTGVAFEDFEDLIDQKGKK
jgi:hypothetical protein